MCFISILTTCTKEKAITHPDLLTQADFRLGKAHLEKREKVLGSFVAKDFYTGYQHKRLLEVLNPTIELKILSAGYGLIDQSTNISPYDCTFKGMEDLIGWSKFLNIPSDIKLFLESKADLRIVLLSDDYLKAVILNKNQIFGAPTLFVLSEQLADIIPKSASRFVIQPKDSQIFNTHFLKAEIGARIIQKVVSHQLSPDQIVKGDLRKLLV